eukprot:jgi/Tetstr1/440669/TSEL_028978.t1
MHTDWSRAGVGACLSQVDDNGVEYAVSFASRMNTPVEADLSSYEGEVGAVVWAVQRFRYYMYGNHFQLITDCKAMEWLRTAARLRGKFTRWSLILAEYDFSIKHRPGKDNTVPDLLSRRPMPAEPVKATSDAAGTTTAIATQRKSPAAMADASAMFGGCTPSSWHNDKVWLHTGDTAREVPKPEERPDAIRRVHASIGHLGRDRTYQVLARHFVRPGMHKDVGAMVKQCRACDRVKASFNQKHDRLKPMPLFGLFYRFSVDSAGPLPTSSEGHKYVIVIVEHFSKWIELVHVRDLEASTTAKAFHERVLAHYGAPVEVVTDNGTEYQGAFRKQLERHGIQPVDIPPGHPQPNGMAERIVQVLKIGSYVYVAQPTLNTLDVRTARTILRVVEILESGWLRLSGSDGNEIQVHMDNCAPCHLSNLVPARYGRGMPACKGCGSDSIAAPRLICDKCQAMWHVACAKAELYPGEEWLCPDCAPPLRR